MSSLIKTSAMPLYYQLKEIFIEMLKSGEWQEGQEIPSERELMEEYDVSRSTVRQALNELALNGMILKKQGRGTFVPRTLMLQKFITTQP